MSKSHISTDSSKIKRSSLDEMGEALKGHLERHGASVFASGSHYLIEVKGGDEASQSWMREGNERAVGEEGGAVRLVYRMMSGVLKKHTKTTFPWTTFCFRPSVLDLGEAGGLQSFLNLQAINNVSNTLWAMVRVHERPWELCVYVGRHIPDAEEVIEPQLRLPLSRSFKLKADGAVGSGGLFSDNPHIGKALQVAPIVADLNDDAEVSFTFTNISADAVTICELGGRDEEEEEVPLEGVALTGLAVGQVIQPSESVAVTARHVSDAADGVMGLAVGYVFGEGVDLDAEDFFGADEEVSVALQGEISRVLHAFLMQGHAYEMIRLAFSEPERLIELASDIVDISSLMAGSLNDIEEPTGERPSAILLNEPDFFGNSLGTVPFTLKTGRPAEHFEGQLSALSSEEIAERPVRLSELNLRFEGHPSAPEALSKFSAPRVATRGKGGKAKEEPKDPQVNLDLIYLGHLAFYNDLSTPDHAKMRSFFLNCVALASLIRAVPVKGEEPLEEL